ncbi:BadF/BadG/BcrA/BcrD ATPase family protein [Acetobacter sp.]|uniref:BadF/BadG/BcrA/BcrD ATPase family protein n=1 Tax=Acetobacter sp. TaxID=440 RepID=UPI0025C23499|nr:BadF/BadG/BcrA/BcrD ATPase family protein [Acetobacter sp.]MCH4092579.1 ATPase [Acetobacter sp.]MCI1299713.1 ATPase [Acetobacter sp.]MCI1315407.1 ATPase [Acetobacter sp.]
MTNPSTLLVAIDAGATKTALRIATPSGDVLGEGFGGPANIATSVEQAAKSMETALRDAVRSAGLDEEALHDGAVQWIAAAGAAGAEVAGCTEKLKELLPYLTIFDVRTDAYTSCLGAHGGEDGAIVAIGTGSVGYAIRGDRNHRVGGWGFPQDDEGGGARIGLEAVRHMLAASDGRATESALSVSVRRYLQEFGKDPMTWSVGASAADFAVLAPVVLRAAENGCDVAANLLENAGRAIAVLVNALLREEGFSELKVAFTGGLASALLPWCPQAVRDKGALCQGTSLDGAMRLAMERICMV